MHFQRLFIPGKMDVDIHLVTGLPFPFSDKEIKSNPDFLEISEEKTDVSR
jgi:hypothetical protein